MTEYLDLNLLLIGLLVWAALTYNRKRKARWAKLRKFEADLRAANLRYYLATYCGKESGIRLFQQANSKPNADATLNALSHKPIPLN